MQRVAVPEPMMAELRKRTAPMVVDFCERVPPAEKPIKAYLAEMKRA
jgi:hypothetical protein